MAATDDAGGDAGGPAVGDALLVALAILALIVAAFALPPLGPSAATPDDGPGPGPGPAATTPTPGATQTPSIDPNDVDGRDSVRITEGSGGGESGQNGTVLDERGRATEPHPDCFVVVWDRLVPGDDATVLVWNDRHYVARQEVWFDGRSIGRTNANGRVDGHVPYRRTLEVTANVPPVDTCRFLHLEARQDYDAWVAEHGRHPSIVVTAEGAGQRPRNGNVSATLPVRGRAHLSIEGEPYPGETIELEAAAEDEPMRSSTVTVDGERVGETDSQGRHTVRVPDDGRDEITLRVERGDFGTTRTVDVLVLSVNLRSGGVLALPGQQVTAVARVADRRASNVDVGVAGEPVGTTGAAGTASFELPANPLATVSAVGAHGQTATAAVWPLYLPTAVAVVLLLGTLALSVRRTRGESGPRLRTIAAGWLGIAALAVAWIVDGPRGVALLLGAGALLGVGALAIRYRECLRRWSASALGLIRGAGPWILGLARRLATVLLRVAERGPAVVRRVLATVVGFVLAVLRGGWRRLDVVLRQPRRLPDLLRELWRWLRHHGARLRRRLDRWTLLGLLGGTLLVAAAGWYADADGGLGMAAVLLGVWLFWRWRRSSDEPTERERGGRVAATAGTPTGGRRRSEDDDEPTLRELFRAFARWVVPGRWQTRTPGEVARLAVDRGFPREPVEQLTDVFREVEYGDRSLSDERWGRARAAFDALRSSREEEARE